MTKSKLEPNEQKFKENFIKVIDRLVQEGHVRSQRRLSHEITGDVQTFASLKYKANMRIQISWVLNLYSLYKIDLSDLVEKSTQHINIEGKVAEGRSEALEKIKRYLREEFPDTFETNELTHQYSQ